MSQSGREIVGETLRVLRSDLDSRVVPHLTNPDACLAAKMISDLLAYLAMWHLDLPEQIATHTEARQGLVDAGGTPPSEFADEVPVAGSEIGRLANAIQRRIEEGGPQQESFLAAVSGADHALYANEQELLQSKATAARDRLALVETEVTPERATAVVEACLGPGHVVTAVARIPGGYSKDSFFLSARTPLGEDRELVARRDLPFGPGETRVVDEYALLTRLFRCGLPIAEPLGCDGTGILGQPALLSERVPGASGTAPWDADRAAREDACQQLAGVLARLHSIVPTDIGLEPVSNDPREQLRAYVLEWRDRWRRNRIHASPTLAAAFQWLLANIPAEIDRLAIVHGDVGFHNIVMDQGRLAALVDWEFAHLGDPTEDLSYGRQMIEPLMPWNDFLAAYRAAGGGEYRAENARFFELWCLVRNAVTCSVAWRGFLSGAYPALKMAYQGVPLYRMIVCMAAQALEERLQCAK